MILAILRLRNVLKNIIFNQILYAKLAALSCPIPEHIGKLMVKLLLLRIPLEIEIKEKFFSESRKKFEN